MRRILLATALFATLSGGAAVAATDTPAPGPAPDPLLGAWALTVDGALAGPVASVDGCGLAAAVTTAGQTKQVAGVAPETCTIEVGTNLDKSFYQWLNDSLAGKAAPHAVQLIRVDNNAGYALALTNATVRSFALPKLDRGSAEGKFFSVTLAAEALRRVPGVVKTALPAPRPFAAGKFKLLVGGQYVDAATVGPWTASVPLGDVGETRLPVASAPARLGELPLRVAEASALSTLAPWVQAFLVDGQSGDDSELPLTLAFDSGLQLALERTGPSRGDLVARADGNRAYSLYSERATLR
jgi:hypothetical protein